MRFIYVFAMVLWTVNSLYAETPDHHAHQGTIEVKLNYEFLDFDNSKQKEDGRRYGVTVDHQDNTHHYQLYVEHTDTYTKPILPKDLSVNKYAFKYQYTTGKAQNLSLSYIQIDDNLVTEVDGGKIYGFGYTYKAFTLMQYISDYKHFNTYQTDVKWGMKRELSEVTLKGALIGKYIYLQDRLSNDLTKKAEQDYFTVGLKVHAEYDSWHVGAVGYLGDRIFAVMNEGLRVQHHAMAFDKSYMFSVGKEFDDMFVNLMYIKQFATEVPIENEDVEATNIVLNVSYRF